MVELIITSIPRACCAGMRRTRKNNQLTPLCEYMVVKIWLMCGTQLVAIVCTDVSSHSGDIDNRPIYSTTQTIAVPHSYVKWTEYNHLMHKHCIVVHMQFFFLFCVKMTLLAVLFRTLNGQFHLASNIPKINSIFSLLFSIQSQGVFISWLEWPDFHLSLNTGCV